jgi:hypothetical protein
MIWIHRSHRVANNATCQGISPANIQKLEECMLGLKTKKKSVAKNTSKLAASNFAKKILKCIYGAIEVPYLLISYKTTPSTSPLSKKIVVTRLVKVNKTDLPIVTSITLQLEKHAKVWMLNGFAEVTLKREDVGSYKLFFETEDGATFRPFNKAYQKMLNDFKEKIKKVK